MNAREIAARLRLERRIRELTQVEVADIVGVDRDDISGYETGKKNPRFDTFVAWAQALGFEFVIQPKVKA